MSKKKISIVLSTDVFGLTRHEGMVAFHGSSSAKEKTYCAIPERA